MTNSLIKNAEYEARDTQLLPKQSSKNYDAMLGWKPQQKTRDGRDSKHVKSHRLFKEQRNDTFVWTIRLFILLLPVKTLNLYLARSGSKKAIFNLYISFIHIGNRSKHMYILSHYVYKAFSNSLSYFVYWKMIQRVYY